MDKFCYFVLAVQSNSGGITSWFYQFTPVLLIGMLVLFIFSRYQSKKETRRKEFLESITSGDKIVTIGGIYGTITSVKENSFYLKISENISIEMMRDAVYTILQKSEISNREINTNK